MIHALEGYEVEPLRMRAGWRPAVLTDRIASTAPHGEPATIEARFPVVGRLGETRNLVVHHPWPGHTEERVALGRIILRGPGDEIAELFSFGGQLLMDVGEHDTTCRMTAPAPIVPLQYAPSPVHHEIETDLASEVEALLARLRATTHLEHDDFDRRLNAHPPDELFLASLASLRDVLDHLPPRLRRRRGYQIAGHMVQDLVERAGEAGRWRESQPRLAELLATEP